MGQYSSKEGEDSLRGALVAADERPKEISPRWKHFKDLGSSDSDDVKMQGIERPALGMSYKFSF